MFLLQLPGLAFSFVEKGLVGNPRSSCKRAGWLVSGDVFLVA